MRKFLALVFSPWMLRMMGALALSLVIWFAGPLIAFADYRPLDPPWARVLLIALLVGLWLGSHLLKQIRSRSGNKKFLDVMVSRAAKSPDAAGAAHVRERFEKAAALLKTTRFSQHANGKSRFSIFGGRRYAYQLPWFVFIGAPGSGKTTALTHSGLRFPLADTLGSDPLHGIGGTRHCEWWFTDDAVLIDTAGRYTTQDSDANADASEWQEFLRLIKQFRPRQPINGILATISASDLLNAHNLEAELSRQAAAIRSRINELQHYLGHGFPVYLLVTKTDLLPGFSQFFENLTREQREQVWGCTFTFKEQSDIANGIRQLKPELDALESSLFGQMLDRVQSGRDTGTRALMYGFPNQWVQLKESVLRFAADAFGPSQLTSPAWLRGVYFTSGTQEGTPIDRILGTLARTFSIERKVLPPQRPSGKSFFIARLLRDVIFAESALAGINTAEERRLRTLKWGGIATLGLALLVSVGLWTVSYLKNNSYVDEIEAKAASFKKNLADAPPDTGDFAALLALLDKTRGLAHTAAVDPDSPPPMMTAGLFQGEKLQAGATQSYERLLSSQFAPLISKRIATGLILHAGNPELQYETLKAYLMLHQRDRLDPRALKGWVAFDLENGPGPKLAPEDRQRILVHLDSLLRRDAISPDAAADHALVAAVRRTQLQAPFVQRVYNRLKRQSMNSALKEFRIADAAGANAQLVFARRSGQPLTQGMPGIFTYDGYHKGFNIQLDLVLRQLADEEVWVLGVKDSENARRARDPTSRIALSNEVRRLYLQDYAAVWEQFIGDIALIRTQSLAQSVEQAKILSAPDSPLPRLLRALVRETTLAEPEKAAKTPADKNAADKLTEAINESKNKLGTLLGPTAARNAAEAANGGEAPVEAMVDERFASLRRLVQGAGPNQPAPIDATLGLINDLYGFLVATETALKAGNTPPQSEVPNKLRAEAGRMPEPLRTMFSNLANISTNQALTINRANLSGRLATLVGEPCESALAGRYPFVANSKKDVLPDDFARIFAQDGLLDSFFQKNLAAVVDNTSKPWRYRNLGDGSADNAGSALAQFERAEEIRRVFFPPGSRGLSFRLDIRPVSMDRAIAHFTMDLDGQLVSYAHQATAPMTVQWPGPRASNEVRLQLLSSDGEATQIFEGPWALFRMFDRAQITLTPQPERFHATLAVEGKKIMFDITAGSVKNPFRMPELQAFRCPTKL